MQFTAIPIPSPELERWLDGHVPYRIQVLRGLDIYNGTVHPYGPLRPVFPCIFEANLIACRWAASFLGLCLVSGALQLTTTRKSTDVYTVDLGGKLIDLTSLSAADRDLLATVFKGANVASAHAVREGEHAMVPERVQEAASLLIANIETNLYGVLGRKVPQWQ